MRSAWRSLLLFVFLCAGAVLLAQEHAKPRDDSKPREAPPKTAHPSPGAVAPAPAPAPPSGGAPGATSDARARHPRPGREAVPRPPKPPAPPPDARARHPRPDPHHAYRQHDYRWNSYQHEWLHGSGYFYFFPHRYPGPRWRVLFRGFYLSPHARLPYDDGWFYWPFEDRPYGCGWYRVPTRRTLVVDPELGEVYRYWRWRYLYLCVD